MNGATKMIIATIADGVPAATPARKLRTNAALQPIITTALTSSRISRRSHHHAQ
jgi:hypothetical protein